MSRKVLLSWFRAALFRSHSLSTFCNLVVNSLDFYGQLNLQRVQQEPLEQTISLGYQLLSISFLIVYMF